MTPVLPSWTQADATYPMFEPDVKGDRPDHRFRIDRNGEAMVDSIAHICRDLERSILIATLLWTNFRAP